MHFHLQDSVLEVRDNHISRLSIYSYAVDWIFYILILVGSIIYGTLAPPRAHEFLTTDITLMHSYKPEDEVAIPIFTLILIAMVFPIAQFFACSISSKTLTAARKSWDIFIGLMCLCGGLATQLMTTVILKNICGLPRPDLLARCDPEAQETLTLSSLVICQNADIRLIHEGFRAFPSGHLSTVFCGMVISSLNIAGKLQVFDKRGISFKAILAIFPIMVACFVSCTRISDNRHFLRDVIGGSVIGTQIGLWFYSQYFPSIFDLENCGRAYPPRRIGISKLFNNVGGFWKIKEYLPGSFQLRNLNSSKSVQYLNQMGTDLTNIPDNIKVVNELTKQLGDKCVDITKGQNVIANDLLHR